jgi:hypothetical protein
MKKGEKGTRRSGWGVAVFGVCVSLLVFVTSSLLQQPFSPQSLAALLENLLHFLIDFLFSTPLISSCSPQ